jgi:hypothetical protein
MGVAERLASVQRRLAQYYAAETATLMSQSYEIDGRTLTRANLREIRTAINDLESIESELTSELNGKGKRWSGRIIPRDL